MKKIILIVTIFIIVMACNQGETAIKVNKTTERYELVAVYPDKKEKHLNECLATFFAQDSFLLKAGIDAGKEVKLANGTIFYLRYNPRKLEIEMLLEKNNSKGRQVFDEMAKEIKRTLN